MPSPLASVLDTNELLEHIIGFLPFYGIVLAQGVSRHWRAVIAGSRRLQRAMHRALNPISPNAIHDNAPFYNTAIAINPQLLWYSSVGRSPRHNRISNWVKPAPLFLQRRLSAELLSENDFESIINANTWLHQTVCQPSCTMAYFAVLKEGEPGDAAIVYNRNGITLADVLAVLRTVSKQGDLVVETDNVCDPGEGFCLCFYDTKQFWSWPMCPRYEVPEDADYADGDESIDESDEPDTEGNEDWEIEDWTSEEYENDNGLMLQRLLARGDHIES
ncbi:hypothetical protein LTR37_004292 [Vermiconidia calcicola]|uniref:Uncharacterized protein n=1 Tax=Vermiconidia calcicola TaxID=1690605 RepID=A0ACC3NMW0_9PEZI|nr:hypothetical protein LTR37_004292 [Vermiconidia calcicola]